MSLLLCSVSVLVNAQDSTGQQLDLNQILDRVIDNSREIKIAEHQLKIKEKLVKDSKYDLLPDFSITGQIQDASNFLIYNNGLFNRPMKHDVIHTLYSTDTNMYLSIYEGLKKKNAIKLREIESNWSEELLLQTHANVNLKAIQLFLDLYLQGEWKKLMLADIEDKQHQLKEISDFYELGLVLQSDVLRAELELSKRQMALIEIENQETIINQQLNVFIGNEDEQLVIPVLELNTLPVIESFDALLREGYENAYDIKLSEYHVLAAEKELDLVKANHRIKLGFTGSFQFSNPQIFLYPYNDSWYTLGIVGLKATLPISELYKNKQKVKASEEAIESAHEHHHKVDDDIRTKIYQDYLAYDESMKYVNIYKLNEQYAIENARIIKDAYFNQISLITDLLDADILVLKSKFELKQGQINVLKNYYKTQYSIGAL